MKEKSSNGVYEKAVLFYGRYLGKRDQYNESRLLKTAKKLKIASNVAKALSLDEDVVLGIIVGDELSRVAYGEIGEEFISLKSDFNKLDYTTRMTDFVLNSLPADKKKKIREGLKHISNERDTSPEEKLANMIIDGFEYADALEKGPNRDICFINYKNRILEYSKAKKELAGPVIPTIKKPRKPKKQVDSAKAFDNLNKVKMRFEKKNNLVPNEFIREFIGFSRDSINRFYTVSLSEVEIEEIAKSIDREECK